MEIGCFYFLTDEYFDKFPDKHLMNNKESVNGILHNRPCFYAFKESEIGIYWTIPFSSQIVKYRNEEKKKIDKYKFCNTILFNSILGHEKAFLIQNMCPVTDLYIKNKYIDNLSDSPVKIDYNFEKKLIKTAKDVLEKVRRGNKYIVFPDVLSIEKVLLEELNVLQEVAITKEK
jgi:hypothetical protein